VTKDTFQLAWNTLVKSYEKPRKLASSIIESLLTAPASTSGSLLDLKQFLNVFDGGLAILESLHVPDLCFFLIIHYRCKISSNSYASFVRIRKQFRVSISC